MLTTGLRDRTLKHHWSFNCLPFLPMMQKEKKTFIPFKLSYCQLWLCRWLWIFLTCKRWHWYDNILIVLKHSIIIIDRFYTALFSVHEHSHVILHEWIAFYRVFLNIHRSGVLTALAWLVTQESAARVSQSRHILCTPYNHALCHFMQSHIRKVYACLAVTCPLRFWQNDWGLLHATAVTRGWTDTEIRVSTESWPWRRKFSCCSSRDSNPRPFDHESGTLTTELSQLLINKVHTDVCKAVLALPLLPELLL